MLPGSLNIPQHAIVKRALVSKPLDGPISCLKIISILNLNTSGICSLNNLILGKSDMKDCMYFDGSNIAFSECSADRYALCSKSSAWYLLEVFFNHFEK